ncbi:hypothetical protein Lal_00025129 [Lupinus albus]|nr:hypothetical protein Lal_00025129 [Lupinus albus]
MAEERDTATVKLQGHRVFLIAEEGDGRRRPKEFEIDSSPFILVYEEPFHLPIDSQQHPRD